MSQSLRDVINGYASLNADANGIARTPLPGVTVLRQTAPTALDYAVSRPLIALVVQGTKCVTMGSDVFTFGAGDSLLITADVPTVSQIKRASLAEPYLSFVVDLDLATIADLTLEMKLAPNDQKGAVQVEPTGDEVADAALRLARLLERPAAIPVLQAQLLREFHYWLLAGHHGPVIRRLGFPDGHVQRIARAVAVLREDFAEPLPVGRLAALAGMSPSTFYQHFRAVTSLSPLQFQKQLRLIEARRLMLSEGMTAGNAAFQVGYESVNQFTREYRRMFGLPPVREISIAKSFANGVSEYAAAAGRE